MSLYHSARLLLKSVRGAIWVMSRRVVAKWVTTISMASYLFICAYIYVTQEQYIFMPSTTIAVPADYGLPDIEERFIKSTDGAQLHVWYKKPEEGKPIFALYPGQMGHVAFFDNVDLMKTLKNQGYGFVSLSWRGYGASTGKPSMPGLYDDAKRIIEFLQAEGHKLEDIIIIGNSMGSAFAVKTAVEHKVKALVLIGTFTQGRDIGKYTFPLIPRSLLKEEYNCNNVDIINKVSAPILMLHGADDVIVHPDLSAELHKAVPESKRVLLENTEHYIPGNVVLREMKNFNIL